jgi:nucleoside-diphosphate-sugar epimerase
MESWDIGVNGMLNVLEVARELGCGVFSASSIAVFGAGAVKERTPQWSVCHPVTIYGITKVTTELLSDYYYNRYGVDARSVRYPGIISSLTLPGGGTTDYAIGMLRAAAGGVSYECPISCDTYLDMLYMPDALEGAVRLMEAGGEGLLCRNGYNITSMSVSPGILCSEIRRYYPNFVISYVIDSLRESIACSWPDSLDDGCARAEWGWDPKYGLVETVRDMLNKLQ